MRARITKRSVDALKPGNHISDTEIRGFIARRLPSGTVTYGYQYRATGKRRWLPLGLHGNITADEARALAKKEAGKVADRRDPAAERQQEREKAKAASNSTVDAVLDAFVERHVKKNLRSAREVERCFNVYVRPRIGNKSIYELRRSDIIAMLDRIADENGEVMADRVLAHTRKAFNWQAARDDTFNPPIAKGMARTKPKERARDRILSDEELRDLFKALDSMTEPACFPKLVKVLLLTAQRREEVSRMHWREIEDGAWTIPSERAKNGIANAVPLTYAVKALLGDRAKGHVFSTDAGKTPFSGFSKAKRALDEKIAELRKADKREPMPHWVLHDLRRTARSLMSRAGVPSDIAERVLNHIIAGVRGVYDRHAYLAEKRDALERLAALADSIISPRDNVVPIRARNKPDSTH
jgi:integrase